MQFSDVPSPQQRIDQLLQISIAPLLKSKGYKKSAHTWYKKSDPITKILNLQLSQSNSAAEAKFTFNLGIHHEIFHLVDNSPPRGKFPKEYECDIRQRIGQLMNTSDHWWTVNWMTNLPSLEIDLKNKIENLALPWLDSFQGLPELLEYFTAHSKHFDAAITAHLLALPEVSAYLAAALQIGNPYHKRTIENWGKKTAIKPEPLHHAIDRKIKTPR